MVSRPKTNGPESTPAEIRACFDDHHVHMALIVGAGGHLLTTIERSDLANLTELSTPLLARDLGTLEGRTVGPSDTIDEATSLLRLKGRRRLAVVDDRGRLVGLLCLKQDGSGYCSDETVTERAGASGLSTSSG